MRSSAQAQLRGLTMATLEFPDQGKEFPVSYRMLLNLAEKFPIDKKYSSLAKELLKLGIISISDELLRNAVLSIKDGDEIWEGSDLQTRALMLKNPGFMNSLSNGQADDIIRDNYGPALTNLAASAHFLFANSKDGRLDKEKREELMAFLLACKQPGVRFNLANDSRLPRQYRATLFEQIAFHVPWDALDFNNMDATDLPELERISPEAVSYLAHKIKDLRKRPLREAAIQYLSEHPDPGVRLNLAQFAGWDGSIPGDLLPAIERLCGDPEPDVAAAAEKSLAEYREYYEKD